MAPKKKESGIKKKLKAAGAAAAISAADDVPLPNPADALTDAELEAKNKERDLFGLAPLKRSEGVSAPPPAEVASSPHADKLRAEVAVATQQHAAPAPACEGAALAPAASDDPTPSATPPAEPSTPEPPAGAIAAGSALSAKRALDSKPPPPQESAPPATPLPDDGMLLEALRAARKSLATQHKVMTLQLLSNEALAAIVAAKPTEGKALAACEDVGPTRAERYGEPLLVCVRAHIDAIKAAGGADPTAKPEEGMAASSSAAATSGDGSSSSSATTSSAGNVTVRFSHYCDSFALSTACALDFGLIDAKYCLSHVFKGRFNCRLKLQVRGSDGAILAAKDILPDGGRLTVTEGAAEGQPRTVTGQFSGLEVGKEYLLTVDEDPKHKQAAAKAPLKGGSGFGRSVGGGVGGRSRGAALVTAELKKLSPDELRAGGARCCSRGLGRRPLWPAPLICALDAGASYALPLSWCAHSGTRSCLPNEISRRCTPTCPIWTPIPSSVRTRARARACGATRASRPQTARIGAIG